jgi:hypothetical protein
MNMQTDEMVRQSLEGADVAQVIEVLYSEVQTLLQNDPEYFGGGRAGSVVHTLKQLIAMIEG